MQKRFDVDGRREGAVFSSSLPPGLTQYHHFPVLVAEVERDRIPSDLTVVLTGVIIFRSPFTFELAPKSANSAFPTRLLSAFASGFNVPVSVAADSETNLLSGILAMKGKFHNFPLALFICSSAKSSTNSWGNSDLNFSNLSSSMPKTQISRMARRNMLPGAVFS